jgi:ribonuclease E
MRESRRSIPDPRREMPAAVPEALWDGGEDSEFEGSDSDLELMNHPSYQERGGANSRRRRRRRPGEEGPPNREANITRGPTWDDATREPSRRFAAPTTAAVPTLVPRSELTNESPVAEEAVVPREGRLEERRGRLRRDAVKPTAEPPEAVHVEMTPDEQDVYAWMGISPLVLATQEVKNPKSAMVLVTLPGESPVLPPPPAPRAAPTLPKADPNYSTSEAEPQDQIELIIAPLPIATSTAAAAVAGESDSEDDGTVTRRRRRRSSAATD